MLLFGIGVQQKIMYLKRILYRANNLSINICHILLIKIFKKTYGLSTNSLQHATANKLVKIDLTQYRYI